jgi:3-phenylpropionate/trans-cinnamate dioxygenase ferredoxin reductase component
VRGRAKPKMHSLVVIGAGQAGGWAANTFRDQKFAGRVVLVGDERHPPYERPPLSKDVLLGHCKPSRTYLWSAEKLREIHIDLMLGSRAEAINREAKTVTLINGETLYYDRLMITTGCRVRRLQVPGADLPGVHYLRNIEDVVSIGRSLVRGSRLLVVGGGWIGLEVAAAARQKGLHVVLVEAAPRLCARVLPDDMAAFLHRQHRERGVEIRLNASVAQFSGEKRFMFATLTNGETIDADVAVVGIGVVPNSELAGEAGLRIDNGIVVDASGRTSDESIYAAGDVASQPDAVGRCIRQESWSNAQNQAIAAAKAMLGADVSYRDVPYFWSDQYDLKLQILGSFGSFSNVVCRGDQSGQHTRLYLKNNRIVGVAAMNSPQDIGAARRLMQRDAAMDVERLATAPSLNDVVRDPRPLGAL